MKKKAAENLGLGIIIGGIIAIIVVFLIFFYVAKAGLPDFVRTIIPGFNSTNQSLTEQGYIRYSVVDDIVEYKSGNTWIFLKDSVNVGGKTLNPEIIQNFRDYYYNLDSRRYYSLSQDSNNYRFYYTSPDGLKSGWNELFYSGQNVPELVAVLTGFIQNPDKSSSRGDVVLSLVSQSGQSYGDVLVSESGQVKLRKDGSTSFKEVGSAAQPLVDEVTKWRDGILSGGDAEHYIELSYNQDGQHTSFFQVRRVDSYLVVELDKKFDSQKELSAIGGNSGSLQPTTHDFSSYNVKLQDSLYLLYNGDKYTSVYFKEKQVVENGVAKKTYPAYYQDGTFGKIIGTVGSDGVFVVDSLRVSDYPQEIQQLSYFIDGKSFSQILPFA